MAISPASHGPTRRRRRGPADVPRRHVADRGRAAARPAPPLGARTTRNSTAPSATVRIDGSRSLDELTTRFGFRDFRFADGYFRLNGRRLLLRSTHTCNHFPIGLQFPHDPDLLRRDLLNLKAMGFNAVRFIWGGATPEQLDYCDEIGLLVYEESYASAPIADGPKMIERFDSNVVRADSPRPQSPERGDLGPAQRGPRRPGVPARRDHAPAGAPARRLADGAAQQRPLRQRGPQPDRRAWPACSSGPRRALRALGRREREPRHRACAGHHLARGLARPAPRRRRASTARSGGRPNGPGKVAVEAVFTGIAEQATTDVHVLHNGRPLFDGGINLGDRPNVARFTGTVVRAAGRHDRRVVGYGNGSYGADSTALALKVRAADGHVDDAAADFSAASNPAGPWSYGRMKPGDHPDAATFARFPVDDAGSRIGSLSNPGSSGLGRPRQRPARLSARAAHGRGHRVAPHARGRAAAGVPLGVRHRQRGRPLARRAALRTARREPGSKTPGSSTAKLERVSSPTTSAGIWPRSTPAPRTSSPRASQKMAGQRTLGLNAIRSNPHIVGHSLTGAIDHVMCGEGLTTLFRELKPGTIDALFDAWAPLRWCLFAEPGARLPRAEGPPRGRARQRGRAGPGHLPRAAPGGRPAMRGGLDRTVPLVIPPRTGTSEPPLAIPCFNETDRDRRPRRGIPLHGHVHARCGRDGRRRGVLSSPTGRRCRRSRTRSCSGATTRSSRAGCRSTASGTARLTRRPRPRREVILAGVTPPAGNRAEAFRALARHVARGSTAIFLAPEVFGEGDRPERWLPLEKKGTLVPITRLALPEGRVGEAAPDLRGHAGRRPDGLHLLSRDHSRPRLRRSGLRRPRPSPGRSRPRKTTPRA